MRQPRCPLCDALVDDDASLRDHLATIHDLEDDPGTETTLDTLQRNLFIAREGEGEGAEAGTVLSVPQAVPTARVYDPDPDDERWRPIAIGVGGLLLLILTVFALTMQL